MEKRYADLPGRSELKVSFAPGCFIVAERGFSVCGLLKMGFVSHWTDTANKRVTSYKPLTAASELVSGAADGACVSGKGARLRRVVSMLACALCPMLLPCVDELRWSEIARVTVCLQDCRSVNVFVKTPDRNVLATQ